MVGRRAILGALLRAGWAGMCWLSLALVAHGQPGAGESLDLLEEIAPGIDAGPAGVAGQGAEVVRERFPDGRVRLERTVALDENENYVNHGPWILYDSSGAKLLEGRYQWGQPHGLWTRWYRQRELALLQELPYTRFDAPFVSQATFRNGRLDGLWTIYDGHHRKISEISFTDDQRNGPSVWWLPTGAKLRELSFVDGDLHGVATLYREDGQIARRENYEHGRRVAHHVEKGPDGKKVAEGTLRYPAITTQTPDNWWRGEFAHFQSQGEGEREGLWTTYHASGQRMMVGQYQHGVPVGRFTWWHENGQRSLVSYFEQGERDGRWTWWHPNGVKMSQGDYRGDHPVGQWAFWDAHGKLERSTATSGPADLEEQAAEAIAGPLGHPDHPEELAPPAADDELHQESVEELPVSADFPELLPLP